MNFLLCIINLIKIEKNIQFHIVFSFSIPKTGISSPGTGQKEWKSKNFIRKIHYAYIVYFLPKNNGNIYGRSGTKIQKTITAVDALSNCWQ